MQSFIKIGQVVLEKYVPDRQTDKRFFIIRMYSTMYGLIKMSHFIHIWNFQIDTESLIHHHLRQHQILFRSKPYETVSTT